MSCTSPISTWDAPGLSGQGVATGSDRLREGILPAIGEEFLPVPFVIVFTGEKCVQVSLQRVSLSHGFSVTCGVRSNLVGSAGNLLGLSCRKQRRAARSLLGEEAVSGLG